MQVWIWKEGERKGKKTACLRQTEGEERANIETWEKAENNGIRQQWMSNRETIVRYSSKHCYELEMREIYDTNFT